MARVYGNPPVVYSTDPQSEQEIDSWADRIVEDYEEALDEQAAARFELELDSIKNGGWLPVEYDRYN